MKNKRLFWLIAFFLTLVILKSANITAPHFGDIISGSVNLTISNGSNGPTVLTVTNMCADTGGTTVIGLTNANSPLFFPFMGFTYAARFVVISEAWTGLTNGVIHWRGDGANPGSTCISPREFWFQTNWNWTYCASALGHVVFSNDVGKINVGTVALDVELISTSYTNITTARDSTAGYGYLKYVGVINVSNGAVTIPSTFNGDGPIGEPLDCSLYMQTNGDGSFSIVATNYFGYTSGFCGGYAEYVLVHCRELTTGINWPIH